MNDNSENVAQPSMVRRFLRWLFRWRIVRRTLVALAGLITLAAVLITEENWRGKHAWENYKREWEAKGEGFDIASFIPPPVPDGQNFFTAPIVVRVLNWDHDEDTGVLRRRGTNAVDRIDFSIYRGDSEDWPTNSGSWQRARLTDLKQWQRYFRDIAESTNAFPVAPEPQTPAADVLLALSQFNPALEELSQAGRRPHARLPLKYENGFECVGELLPFLAGVKRCSQMLQLRAIAELGDGQADQALQDVKLLLRLNDSLRNQPFLISHLVRMAMMAITLQPVYEGLAQHQWSETQLAELEHELAKQDFLADFHHAMRGERTFAIASFENQRVTREYRNVEENSGTNRIVTVSFRFMPSAYFYQNELTFARMHQQFILPLVDLKNRIVSPTKARKAADTVQAQMKHFSPYRVQALMLYPAVSKSVLKFAFAQTSIDLARIACELERYRLTNGKLPETLDALTPRFIESNPTDVINGKPLRYQLKPGGGYVLYSIGWNETDDGGAVGLTKSGKGVDITQGDWVWQMPGK